MNIAITNYEEKYQDEYKKALGRIYGDLRQTPEYRARLTMEWVLKFTQMDLGWLSEGDWNNLKYEVACFTKRGAVEDHLLNQQQRLMPLQDWIYIASRNNEYESDRTGDKAEQEFWVSHLPTRNAIENLQEVTKTEISKLLITGFASLTLPEIKVIITSKGQKQIWTKSPANVFLYHFVDLITKFAPLIHKCRECKQVFLALRNTKQYCSVICQSRANMRKYRGTPPDRVGKRGRPPGTGKKKEKPSMAKGGSSHGKKKLKG